MRDRFGATNPRAQALRFHAQTGGSTLTAQQPENNIARVTVQALSAVCGGAQSIHTNAFDEALALPTQRSARIALRTQQILASEAGGTDTADPFGGSFFIESLTDELEARARELLERIDELGGAVAAIEQEWVQREIEDSAFRYTQEVEAGERVIVGVNRYAEAEEGRVELQRIDPDAERRQLERTARVRAEQGRGGGCRRPGRGAPRQRHGREPAAADARCPQGALHRRRDQRRAARGVRHVRLAARSVSAALECHVATKVATFAEWDEEDKLRYEGPRPPLVKEYPGAERLPLDASPAGRLLRDGAGIVRSQPNRDYGGGTMHWRAYSSAGGLFPVEASNAR